MEGWSVINATEKHNRTEKRQECNYNGVVGIGITENAVTDECRPEGNEGVRPVDIDE